MLPDRTAGYRIPRIPHRTACDNLLVRSRIDCDASRHPDHHAEVVALGPAIPSDLFSRPRGNCRDHHSSPLTH